MRLRKCQNICQTRMVNFNEIRYLWFTHGTIPVFSFFLFTKKWNKGRTKGLLGLSLWRTSYSPSIGNNKQIELEWYKERLHRYKSIDLDHRTWLYLCSTSSDTHRVVEKRKFLLRWIHIFCLNKMFKMNHMDHVDILGIEPSSVILKSNIV